MKKENKRLSNYKLYIIIIIIFTILFIDSIYNPKKYEKILNISNYWRNYVIDMKI